MAAVPELPAAPSVADFDALREEPARGIGAVAALGARSGLARRTDTRLLRLESVVLFVHAIDATAAWHAALLIDPFANTLGLNQAQPPAP